LLALNQNMHHPHAKLQQTGPSNVPLSLILRDKCEAVTLY
jgi:hypothetical protein